MLYLRRRSFPEPDALPRATQSAFACALVLANVGWSLGLSLMTYNDDLWRWTSLAQNFVLAVVLTCFTVSGLLAWKWLDFRRLCLFVCTRRWRSSSSPCSADGVQS